jgi:hypothetical protein
LLKQEATMAGDGSQRLPEALAKRVLERAAQLDESERMTVSVPDLRTAAVEAGISSSAVDQALSEIANPPAVSAEDMSVQRSQPSPRPRWRRLALITVVVALGWWIMRSRLFVEVAPATPDTPPTQTTPAPPPPR